MATTTLVKELISYQHTNSFTPIALALHAGNEKLKPFAGSFFSMDNLGAKLAERATFPIDRVQLHKTIIGQYAGLKTTAGTISNIEALLDNNTFTVTTGHQLCLFTGPLYFVYKVIHTINLAKKASEQFPNKKVIPVFWMASEDHDFQEVASVTINGTKLTWDKDAGNRAVGHLDLAGLEQVFSSLENSLGEGPKAKELLSLLKKCYAAGHTLASATRALVNELFGKYGLVIIDGDDPGLKGLFAKVAQAEIENSAGYTCVTQTNSELQKSYKIQVNPRECNLFLFQDGVRRRIDRHADGFNLSGTETHFTKAELLQRLNNQPEDFSPNVILRPVYQEIVLPNLVYIGGGGELAYWLQLRGLFQALNVSFPLLLLRNSVQLIEEDQKGLMDKLGLSTTSIFQGKELIYKALIGDLESDDFYQLKEQISNLRSQFTELSLHVSEKDPTLIAHVEATWKRNEKFLFNLEKKLLRAAKLKHEATLRQSDRLMGNLFPGGGLQERKENIFTYVFRHGISIIDTLVDELDPENKEFTVLYL